MDEKVDVLREEERRQFNRKLVLLVHVLAAFFTALIYISDVDLQRFPYWRRTSGIAALWIAAPPLLPYLISAIHSWRRATYDRLLVAAFLLVLIAGTFGACSAILGAFGLSLDRSGFLWLFAIEAIVYFWSAEFLFDVD
jgi:hypothetical protein